MCDCVPQGDVIFTKWLIGNVGDDQGSKLLKDCYNALPDDRKVIFIEAILPFLFDTSSTTKVTLVVARVEAKWKRDFDRKSVTCIIEGDHDNEYISTFAVIFTRNTRRVCQYQVEITVRK
nr:caffeic acid 3-O-methyltransferase-like [Tanacetum cinerariifolium]